jgi:hypothetical protein
MFPRKPCFIPRIPSYLTIPSNNIKVIINNESTTPILYSCDKPIQLVTLFMEIFKEQWTKSSTTIFGVIDEKGNRLLPEYWYIPPTTKEAASKILDKEGHHLRYIKDNTIYLFLVDSNIFYKDIIIMSKY